MLTTSVGIALHEKGGQSTAELLQNADSALYRAKSLRRGTFHFFDKTLNERLDARKRLERELRAALATDQFELLYQPQISLPDGKITGVEALVRWHHPTRGILGADEFIPLAEETGLIVPVGEWVLREGVRPGRSAGATSRSRSTSRRRSSARAISSPRFAPRWTRPGSRDAASSWKSPKASSSRIPTRRSPSSTSCAQLGVRFAMDDFGTGYSSLGYLHRFRFDKIKLDKSFVRDLGKNPDADAIAHTIIDLARTLKIRANAEGVETQFQLERLIAEGYGEAQGYLFTRPLNCDHIDQFIRAFTPGARASDVARLTESTALAQG